MKPVQVALLLCLLMLAGCMISEQVGEGVGDLSFHFDTQANRVILFGRSAAIAVLAIWVFNSWGAKIGPLMVGIGLLGTSGWLVFRDYPDLKNYRVDVMASGLYMRIPPHPEESISWDSVEELKVEGTAWATVAGGVRPGFGPSAPAQKYGWAELPEWKSMELKLSNGELRTVNLEKLSVEQRQIFWRAIVKHARLVEGK